MFMCGNSLKHIQENDALINLDISELTSAISTGVLKYSKKNNDQNRFQLSAALQLYATRTNTWKSLLERLSSAEKI
jgi:hypothetical protein